MKITGQYSLHIEKIYFFFIVEIGLLKSEKTRRKWGKKKKEIKLLMKMSLLCEATLE